MPSAQSSRTGGAPEPQGRPVRGPGRRGGRWSAGFWTLVVFCILAVAGAGAYVYFSVASKARAAAAGQATVVSARTVPVVAVKAWKADIDVRLLGLLGAVTPLNSVTVRSRVDGQLMEVKFTQGQFVDKDSLLAIIDPRPFDAQLLQAQGQLARDKAFLANARLDLKRYEELLKQDSIAAQQRDTQESLVHQYEGAVQMDQGQVDNAQVQLVYSRITAPLSGRIGLRLVDPGNIIHATDPTGLVVITQLQPISVIFTIAEDYLPDVLAKVNAGERLTVDALDRTGNLKLAEGRLEWVDNLIDPTTGTVRLRAIFPNEKNELFAGQFVNISLLLEVKRGATLAPAAAIQRGPKGTFVYVIGADNLAVVRAVRVGPTEKDNVSFETGLSPGDLVVVEGADRLREGQKVELSGAEGQNSSSTPQEKPPAGARKSGTSAGESKPAAPPAVNSSSKPGAGY